MKQCNKCRVTKSLEDFHRARQGKHGRKSICKQCESDRRKANQYSRRSNYWHKYGITLEDYERMLTAQNGKCAICGGVNPGRHAHFHVDHDHSTGQVRALLCEHCNVGIGYFAGPEQLEAAAQYLRAYL